MRKLLVVGCGGSGGATLSFMMDQLRSELARHGVEKLPQGWQFVHLDVPTSPSEVKNIGSVQDLDGQYVGIGPQSPSYEKLDNALTQRLGTHAAIDAIATWAPRDPSSVTTPLTEGAGQYRALGRMITLSRAGKVREELERAWLQLFKDGVDPEMRQVADAVPGAGEFSPADVPLVLVVSSMAGGAGASMALDVCRILTLIHGIDPELVAVFMVTPDIFHSVPASSVTGTRPNALAMLGEIVASQTGAARRHDVEILGALGFQHGAGELTPFKRVFPIGAHVGAERTQFGDGSTDSVYRGLGRGLAALVVSGAALQQFYEWDLTNSAGDEAGRDFLGWGNVHWDNLPWGSFGYASLSMGRDRYAEYSAQRLARACADKLLIGHRTPGNPASDEEQVAAMLDNQWSIASQQLGLPDGPQADLRYWLSAIVAPNDQVLVSAQSIVNQIIRPRIDVQPGVKGEYWTASVVRVLQEQRGVVLQAVADAAYALAFTWSQHFGSALGYVATESLARLGLPYTTGLVKRASRVVSDQLLPDAQKFSGWSPMDVSDLPDETKQHFAVLKGAMHNPAASADQVIRDVTANVVQAMYSALAQNVANACGAVVGELFDPLVSGLNDAQTTLRDAVGKQRTNTGLADLRTTEYVAWPADSDERVADRFAEAGNEVMLTRSADFKARYEVDLPSSVAEGNGPGNSLANTLGGATYMVISGQWETVTGTPSPGLIRPVVELKHAWVSRAFPRDPDSGDPRIAASAGFDVHVRPAELLARAREYVARPGKSFDRYCAVSLRDYVTGRSGGVEAHVQETELAQRSRDLIAGFSRAVRLSRPLASVNEGALHAIHDSSEMVYRFKFSAVPFQGLALGDQLGAELDRDPRIDSNSIQALLRAMTDEANLKRIDIFGSYPNYSPLVYDAVVEPASRQWQSSSAVERQSFWKYRRTRPLAASLPMHENERRAMVAGWLLGRAIGVIRIPEPNVNSKFTQPVQVWDFESSRWLSFPNPMLTPQAEFIGDYDWLPAVLESILLAMAQSHQPPAMTSMHPYRALRRIFDDRDTGPTSENNQARLAATRHMADWLRTGDLRTGVSSVIPAATVEAGLDARVDGLREYLAKYQGFVGTNFMKSGEGLEEGLPPAPGGGAYAEIAVRAQASATPIFRDLAPDVYWATHRLSGLIDQAAAAARQPRGGNPQHTAPDVAPNTWSALETPTFGDDTGGSIF